jgi:hypothetical protein
MWIILENYITTNYNEYFESTTYEFLLNNASPTQFGRN